MASFLYFVETKDGASSPDLIREAGLRGVLPSSVSSTQCLAGPNGQHGLVMSIRPDAGHTLGYYPERQEWAEGKTGNFWIGMDTDDKPSPKDLAREDQFPGHPVMLSDKREWLIAVVRAVDGTTPLPTKLEYDGTSWIQGAVKPAYSEIFGYACQWWDSVMDALDTSNGVEDEGPPAGEVKDVDETTLAAAALAINYRVGPDEITALELLDTSTVNEVLRALVDWPFVIAAAKKKLRESPLLQPGNED